MQVTPPPVIAVWDAELGAYVKATADVCVALWSSERAFCGADVYRRVGDAGFCAYHYGRVMDAQAAVVRQEDEDYGWSFEARMWDADAAEIIYYLRRESDGLIKIGTSMNFGARLSTLRWEHGALRILMTHRGDRACEWRMHRRFADLNVRGEWFSPGTALLEWIVQVRRRQARIVPPSLIAGTVALSEVEAMVKPSKPRRKRRTAGARH